MTECVVVRWGSRERVDGDDNIRALSLVCTLLRLVVVVFCSVVSSA